MATKKKGAVAKELHEWTVVSNGQEVEVHAHGMEIVDGALMFNVGDTVSKVFADGQWATVERDMGVPV